MLELNRDNLLPYLRAHYPAFDTSGEVTVSAIGDSEEDVPGLVNYIFRVRNAAQSIIVKQGRPTLRAKLDDQWAVPTWRNRMEYLTLKLRHAITPEYVPQVYYIDRENNVFLMEDVSYLRLCRRQLTESTILPLLGKQCARFSAANAFYTSEYYLDTGLFRELSKVFTNTDMRSIMENWVLLRQGPVRDNPLTAHLRAGMEDDAAMAATYQMRHQFMAHGECLIHGDLHTTNLFADAGRLKVIDMEYTFAGPCCYDVGYLLASFVSQYCASLYRTFPTEEARRAFQTYMLQMIYDLVEGFRADFGAFWDRDAKPIYRRAPSYKRLLLDTFLQDIAGYAGTVILAYTLSASEFMLEFCTLPTQDLQLQASQLYFTMGRRLLLGRQDITSTADLISALLQSQVDYTRWCGR